MGDNINYVLLFHNFIVEVSDLYLALIIGISLILLSILFWKKGNDKEPLLSSVIYAFIGIFSGFTFRSFSIFIFLIGSLILLITILYAIGIVTIS